MENILQTVVDVVVVVVVVVVRHRSFVVVFFFVWFCVTPTSKQETKKRATKKRATKKQAGREAGRPRSRDVCVLCVCRVRHGLYAANDSLAGCMWQRSIRGRTRARARNHAVYMQCTLLCD